MEFMKKKDENGKEKKEKMSREKAFKIIAEWVDTTRSRVYGDDLIELQDLLYISVIDERLTLDEGSKRNFSYILEEPIQKKSDPSISMLKIKPQILDKVFESEEKKSTKDKTITLIQTYCKTSDGNDIEIGFMTRIDPRDSLVIQAIITAFFF